MDTLNRSLPRFLNLLSALLMVAALYVGREILVPMALACLLTFLLHPLVNFLCRWHLPRMAGVCVVTVTSFSVLAFVAWLLGGELARLANDLPNHRHNIQQRIRSFQQIGETRAVQRLRELVGDVSESTQQPVTPTEAVQAPAAVPAPPAPPPPANVETALMKALNMIVPALADVLATAAVVTLFVIFMLLRLDDISQRIARLVGHSRLTLTTKAVEESGERVSRYLLMQGTVNAGYGLLLGIGLAVIGLPYVVLWGVLAAMSRFIPYVGPWLAAVLPVSLSLAVFEGWSHPLMVTAFVASLELLTNMIVEPMLYGHSAGVSDFALLLAIAFWTWLWGGVGLVLATPLTVCIVVFCKHIPSLEWVDVMMGENPPPQPHLSYYQHHLADNEDTAQELLELAAKKDGIEAVLENIALPALALTRREEVLGNLDRDEADQMYQSMREGIALLQENAGNVDDGRAGTAETDSKAPPAVKVFARALHGEADVQALQMLEAVLPSGIEMETSSEPRLIGELVDELEKKRPSLVCISALPPRAQLAANTLCRRLRNKLPGLKILVCRWGLPGQGIDPKPLRESGATWVVGSLREARDLLKSMIEKDGELACPAPPLKS
jgi:predicted PurR-regulated permease PerM